MSKLDGIKAGDRVRVQFEGVLSGVAADGGFDVIPAQGFCDTKFDGTELEDDTFQITRIEPALSIGDEVTILGKHKGKVLGFLSNGNVAVEYQAGDTSWCGPYHPSCLTHA